MPSKTEKDDKLEELWAGPLQTGRRNCLSWVWLFSVKLKKVFDSFFPEKEAHVALVLVRLVIVTAAIFFVDS